MNSTTKLFISRLNHLVSGVIALLLLASFGSKADAGAQDDIDLWLKQTGHNNTAGNDNGYAHINPMDSFNNSVNTENLLTENKDNSSYDANPSSKELAKANEKKLLRRISERLKINLFKANNKYSQHKLYINTLKQELIGKSQIGKAKYEFRVSEKQAEARFRYAF